MAYTFWQRFLMLVCRTFGHDARILTECPGGGYPEVCQRCKALLSTEYSRSKRTTP